MQVTNNVSYIMSSYRNAIGALSLSLRLCTLTWHANKFKLTIDVANQNSGTDQVKSGNQNLGRNQIRGQNGTFPSPFMSPLAVLLTGNFTTLAPNQDTLAEACICLSGKLSKGGAKRRRGTVCGQVGGERQSKDARGAKRRPQPGDGARRPASPTNAGKEKGRS